MSIYLVIFDRRVGLLSLTPFTDFERPAAVQARRAAEVEFQGKEVVLLEADSEEALHKTHARYFGKLALSQLASTATAHDVIISGGIVKTDSDDPTVA